MTSTDDPSSEALRRRFLLGTARDPAPAGAALPNFVSQKVAVSELTALALLGQRLRFRRHRPPPRGAQPPIVDSRKIVPDAARPLMRRLAGGMGGWASDVAALAMADTCQRRRLRPHPFDVPRLAGFVRRHGYSLGAYAAAWSERGKPGKNPADDYCDGENNFDSSNWTSARPAARAEFIAAMRRREPDRARELVAASFAFDAAPVRVRLLAALAAGLSPADATFLESLAHDRASTVRERALELLKYIPGNAAAEGLIRDLVARTSATTAGLLRRRLTLKLELPANLQTVSHAGWSAEAVRRWAADRYAGVGLDAMAAAFGLPVTDMVAAAADATPLLALFARQASMERRFDVLARIVREHAADAWLDAIGRDGDAAEDAGRNAAAAWDDATIEQWCAAAIAPGLWTTLPPVSDLERLYRFLRRPLPLEQARELLQSPAFATLAHPDRSPTGVGPLCLALAALTPPPLRSPLRGAFAGLVATETPPLQPALQLLDCLALLDPVPS